MQQNNHPQSEYDHINKKIRLLACKRLRQERVLYRTHFNVQCFLPNGSNLLNLIHLLPSFFLKKIDKMLLQLAYTRKVKGKTLT